MVKKAPGMRSFFGGELSNLDFGADGSFTGKFLDSALDEVDNTVFCCVDSEVRAHKCTVTWDFCATDLSY